MRYLKTVYSLCSFFVVGIFTIGSASAATFTVSDYAELVAALAGAVAGDVIQLGADITTAGPVTVSQAVTIEGSGNTLRSGVANTPVISITASGVRLRNMTISGAIGSAGDSASGILVSSPASDLIFEDLSITQNAGHGIAFSFSGSASNAVISNCTIRENGGIGVIVESGVSLAQFSIVNSIISQNAGGVGGFGTSMTDWRLDANLIQNNTGTSSPDQGGYGAYFTGQAISNLVITNSQFTENRAAPNSGTQVGAGLALFLSGSANYSGIDVTNNTFSNNSNHGVLLTSGSDTGTFTNVNFDCNIIRANGTDGMEILGISITNLIIQHNTFAQNPDAGLNNQSGFAVDARNNYWNSATGPTNAGNPGGTGDAVIGQVTFIPFQTAPSCGGPVPEPSTSYHCQFGHLEKELRCEARGILGNSSTLEVRCNNQFRFLDPSATVTHPSNRLLIKGTEDLKTAQILTFLPSTRPGQSLATLTIGKSGGFSKSLAGSCRFFEAPVVPGAGIGY